MQKISLRDLVAINLKYSAETDSYREMAYAQLSAKALYVFGERFVKVKDIADDISTVLEVLNVPSSEVESGLRYLLKKGITQESGGLWKLTENGNKQVESEINTAAARISSVIKRYFPSRLNESKIKQWIIDAITDFFGRFAEHWIAATCKGTRLGSALTGDLNDLLEPSIRRHGLESEKEALIVGFRQFIGSTFPEDNEQLRCFGIAMYISRLLAANVAADPVTLEQIKGAKLVLDTNVLVVLQLEAHQLTESFTALGKALAMLDIKPSYIQKTKEEYVRIIQYERERMLRVVSRFPYEVVKESKDSFSRTAINRKCVKIEDYERFYDSIMLPPVDFGERCGISLLDNTDIMREANKGESDEKLKQDINNIWERYRRRKKKEEAIKHDAALLSVARYLRGLNQNCLVLTLDIPLHAYCIESSGPTETPLSISLDAMLQIFAVGMAGPQLNPSEFAPLMASILSYQFEPGPNAYTTEDLAWLMDIEERCADLPPEKTQELASRVSRARVAGKSHDDKDLRLEIQRVFQGQKMIVTKEAASTKSELAKQREDTERERDKAKKMEHVLFTEYKKAILKRANKAAIWKISASLIAATALILFLIKLIRSAFPSATIYQILFYFISSCGLALSALVYIIKKVIPEYKQEKSRADDKARQMINEKISIHD